MAKTVKPLERISELFKAVVEKAENKEYLEDDIDTITRQLNRFPEYLAAWNKDVIEGAANSRLLAAGYLDTETYQYRTQTLDESRRITHDAMLSACSQLKRLCQMYGGEKFCPDPEKMHRSDIAQFAGMFVCETCGIDLKDKTLDMYIYNSATEPQKPRQLDTDRLGSEFDRLIRNVRETPDSRNPTEESEKEMEEEVSL